MAELIRPIFSRGVGMTGEQLRASIIQREVFRWNSVPVGAVRDVLTLLSQERGVPISMFGRHDLIEPAEALSGRNLSGLYAYAGKVKGLDQDVMSFLMDCLAVRIVVDDVIHVMRSRRPVIWERVPGDVLGEMLHRLGEEAKKPPSMVASTDFNCPQGFLDGNRLTGLYVYAAKEASKVDKGPIPFLLERADIVATREDAIACINREQKVFWERLPWGEVGGLLRAAAMELGKPAALLSGEDLARPLNFLDNQSLISLREHSMLKERSEGQTPIAFLLEKAGIGITIEDVILSLQSDKQIIWDKIPDDVVLDLLTRAAEEIGIPISMLGAWDFFKPLTFLGNENLARLYNHAQRYMDREKMDPMSHLLDKLDIAVTSDDIIKRIAAGRRIRWERVPASEITNLLNRVAAEMGVTTATLRRPEFDTPIPLLNKHSLIGLYGYFFNHPDRNGRDTMDFIFEVAGIEIKAQDVVSQIREGRSVYWSRVPPEERKTLLEMAANELRIPVFLLAGDDLTRTPLNLLNQHTLAGLYSNAMKDPDKRPEESVMGFIRRKMGWQAPSELETTIRTERSPRGLYRRAELQTSFQRYIEGGRFQEFTTVDQLVPWIKQVAKLYRSPSLDIGAEEIESEVMIYTLQRLPIGNLGDEAEDFLEGLRLELEQILRERLARVYREIPLSTPIGAGLTLEGVMRAPEASITEDDEIGEKWETSLDNLSEIQRKLVYGIAVEGKGFDDMVGELGIDINTLHEHYDDALIILKGTVDKDIEED